MSRRLNRTKKVVRVKKVKSSSSKYSELIPSAKLDQWIKNRYNVLFEGRHGVGKTSIILKAFEKAGLRYAYFSGATMDPFIDFVGVPVKVQTKTGNVIELVRPKHLSKGDIQAIFIDEFNRTHKKVRNAVMELLQYKTINGQLFSKDLRVVWAAINPDSDKESGMDEYDTDRLDKAQRDRFHIQMSLPYECSADYFARKYGDRVASTAVRYWNALPDKVRYEVSPRRLDYALDAHKRGIDIRDVLPLSCNPGKLQQLLSGKGYVELDALLKADAETVQGFFADENNYATYAAEVVSHKPYRKLLENFPKEKLTALLGSRGHQAQVIKSYIKKQVRCKNSAPFEPLLKELAAAKQNRALSSWATACQTKIKSTALVAPKGDTPGKILVRMMMGVIPTPSIESDGEDGDEIDYMTTKVLATKLISYSRYDATYLKMPIPRQMKVYNKFVMIVQKKLHAGGWAFKWFDKRGYTVVENGGDWYLRKKVSNGTI